MHEKGVDPACRGDMGGGSVRAGRGAARCWERQRRTGTGLAVTALAVLGTLLVIREHRQGTDVAPSTADKAAPGAADAGVGRCEHAINPAGGEENRHGSAEWLSSAHSRPTDDCVSYDECRTHVRSRETPRVGSASGAGGTAPGAGEPHAGTGTGDREAQTASERAGQGESRGCGMPQGKSPITGFDQTEASVEDRIRTNDCNDSLYDSFDVMKLKSSGGLPVIVTICLTAIVLCGKAAPWVTGVAEKNRCTRKVTSFRHHAPKQISRAGPGRVPIWHPHRRPLWGRPKHRREGHRTAGGKPAVQQRRCRWAPRAASDTPASWREKPDREKPSWGARGSRRAPRSKAGGGRQGGRRRRQMSRQVRRQVTWHARRLITAVAAACAVCCDSRSRSSVLCSS